MEHNLRHLRVLLAVAEHGSVTQASKACNVSQPAVTQTISKLEKLAGGPLFRRKPDRLYLTESGEVLTRRVERAFAFLDPAMDAINPRLRLMITAAQLRILIAMHNTECFAMAAQSLGIAQPTVQKAINQLERDAGCPLFDRTSHGMLATRECQSLANAARLAFVELAQAEADLVEFSGREVGTVVVGALPFSLSYLLPVIATRFREKRPQMSVKVVHMPFFQLLAGLRRGEIDFLLGGLSEAAPDADIDQKTLFQDSLVLLARSDHPVTRKHSPALEELATYPWVVAPKSTPARNYFEQLFAGVGQENSVSIVDTCSFELMRELLVTSDHLGCISMLQAAREVERGNLKRLKVEAAIASWPIGVTTRSGWLATASQREFLEIVAEVANDPFANSVSL